MVELEESAAALRAQGYGLAAISYDPVPVLANFAARRRITYRLLSDSGSQFIRAAGVLNQQVPQASPFFGIPHPVTLMVDAEARVASRYFEEDYKQRYALSDILVRQFGVDPRAPAGQAQSKYLTATWRASTEVARPGHHIALTLELELKPRMHVYAPGVEGYKPVEWSMEESPAGRAAGPAQFPPSRTLRLEAIDETVPVYTGKVRVVREIALGQRDALRAAAGGGGTVTLRGTFRYQACDDTTCYLPAAIPLEWTFRVEDLDTERVPADLQRRLK